MAKGLAKIFESNLQRRSAEKSFHSKALLARMEELGEDPSLISFQNLAPLIAHSFAVDAHGKEIIELAQNIPADHRHHFIKKLLGALQSKIETPGVLLRPWGSDPLLIWLKEEADGGEWSDTDQGFLNLLYGLRFSLSKAFEKSLECLFAGIQGLSQNQVPRRKTVGSALFEAGFSLAEKKSSSRLAEQAYRASIQIGYMEAMAWNNLADLPHISCEPTLVEQYLQQAVEIEPEEALYWRNLGDHYREQERFEAGRPCYEKALELEPNYAAAHNGLGLLYEAQASYKKAEMQFLDAIRSDPNNLMYPRNLAEMLQAQGEYRGAEPWVRLMTRKFPDDVVFLNSLAWIIFCLNDDLVEAELLAKKAVSLAPTNVYLIHTMASIVISSRGWPYARKSIDDWLQYTDRGFLEHNREDSVVLIREIIRQKGGTDFYAMLSLYQDVACWKPWLEALEKIIHPDDSSLKTQESIFIYQSLIVP